VKLLDTNPDHARWRMVAIAGSLIRTLAMIAIKYKVPKHTLQELFSEAYDAARNNARSPQ
jgi:hypothetical protein